MVAKLHETTVAEVCKVYDGPHATPAKTDAGPIFLGITSLNKGRIDLDKVEYLSEADFVKWTRRVTPQAGDVVFSYETKLGEAAMIPEGLRCCLGRRMALMRPDPNKVDSRFLLYYYLGPMFQDVIRERTIHGSTVERIALIEFPRFPLHLPTLAEQQAIGSVLGALDDKIELNRRMNATVEAIVRTLFQSWFVKFDPVRAKTEYCPPNGIDNSIAALFPSQLQNSEIGQIPLGWRVGVLDELISFVIGGDWGASEPTDEETVPCFCIRGADIPSLQEGIVGKLPTRFLKPSSVEKRRLMDGDIAIEISGGSPTQSTGRPVLASDALLQHLGQPLVASNFCRILKLKSPAFSKFVYCWLRRLYDAGELYQFETGTTGIKNFGFVRFSEKYPFVVPDPRVVEAFDRIVSPFYACIQANAQQSCTLAALRDALLPKLLSGEISLLDVEVNTK